MRPSLLSRTALVLAVLVSPALAQWCGHCGNVHLSFAPDSLVAVRSVDVADGPAVVDLYAVLADVPPIRWRGMRVTYAGGFELRLVAEGEGVEILGKEVSAPCVDLGREPAACQVGSTPGFPLREGRAELVRWRVLVPRGAHDVVFRLAPDGAPSCERTPDCRGSGSLVMWAGSAALGQEGLLFSAGYVPAYLNRTSGGEPDLTPVRGRTDWQELGVVTVAPDDSTQD